jgi:hypothetical protein
MPDVFPIVPASAKPIWFLGAICALLTVVCAALLYTAHSARNSRVRLTDEHLELVGDFWARSIPIRSIRADEGRIVDLGSSSGYAPRRRTFGTGVPGYTSGWFRLQNGEKALLYVTRWDSVVYLPTSLGYSLLLSTERPEELLAAVRSRREP